MNRLLSVAVQASLFTSTLGLLLVAGQAGAVTQPRDFAQNATGACQAALPAFEGFIRKRLLVVSNDGTSTAVVTCSLMGTIRAVGGSRSIKTILFYVDNNTGSPVDVTCTMADGYSGNTQAYIAKTNTLPANSKVNTYSWSAASDNGGDNFFYMANVSCALPPGTAIGPTFVIYDQDVGL